jgi:Fur family peroxide stress response transcriptional regulator
MSKRTHKLDSGEIDAQVARMAAALREAGLRLTPQRVAVCRVLAESRTHPTAHALFEQLSAESVAFSRATVYNTLETLARHGLARELVVAGDGAMRYDADVHPHAHLVCIRCHRVEDYEDAMLDRQVERVSGQTGYALQGLCVFYHGLCPRCQRKRE